MRAWQGVAWGMLVNAFALATGSHAVAQEFPIRPVRIIVPNSPGAASDQVARVMAPEMANVLGKPVVVENKPGAQERIGAEYVAKQVPNDGHVAALVAVANMASLPVLVKDPPFIPMRDLPPLKTIVTGRIFLASPVQQPFKTFNEMVAYAKANPGKLNYGSWAVSTQLRLETINHTRGINVVHVPFPNSGAAHTAMYANDIHLVITNDGIVSQKERVNTLAVSGVGRLKRFPDVPTFVELGMPSVPGIDYYLGLAAGTPKVALDRIASATSQSFKSATVESAFTKLGLEAVDDTPDGAMQNLKLQTSTVATIARQIGLQPQ